MSTADGHAPYTANERALLDYIVAMDAANYDAAIGLFAPDAVFIHPPLPVPGTPRGVMGPPAPTTIRGHGEIKELFRRRGDYPTVHEVWSVASEGAETFLEGKVTLGGVSSAVILVHASFSNAGAVERYVALR